MRKEVLFAIIFGTVIGLIVTFGVLRVNGVMKQNLKEKTSQSQTDSDSQTPDDNKNGSTSITLLKPTDHQVSGSDTVSVSGLTAAESFVIATGGTYDLIMQSGKDGTFDFEYEIEPSLNTLNIVSVSSLNQRSKTELELVYSSEATQKESEDIEEKVEDKLENVQNTAIFYQGTVTDLTEEGIQIETTDGEIKQVSYTNDETSFAKIGKTTTKISISDVALGDYIIALGYKRDNGLLDAFRILVTQPATRDEVNIFFGTVSTKNKTDMQVSEKDIGETDIEIDNNTKTYQGILTDPERIRFSDIKEGNLVIGTYLTNAGKNIARRIYILNNPPSDD